MALPGIVVLLAAIAVLGPSVWTAMTDLRRAARAGVLPRHLLRGHLRAERALRRRGTRLRSRATPASSAGTCSDRGPRSRHHPGGERRGHRDRDRRPGLDFIGVWSTTSLPNWGSMLNDGFQNIYSNGLLVAWPSLAIGLTCIALVLLGNALRDVLERSGGGRRRRRRGSPIDEAPAAEPVIVHAETEAPRGEELLRVAHLAVGYGQPDGSVKRVVHDVSLTVRRGEVHGLIGESGSGKTQTAWSILRLLPQGGRIVGGAIHFEGKDLARSSEKAMVGLRGSSIAYIPQEPMSNLDPSFTIGSQLSEPIRVNLGLSKPEAKQRAIDLLTRVGIPNPERTYAAYPHEVSGGMAQRVLIAGAVSCNPDLLIADEPTTALDVTVQAEVLDLLRSLQARVRHGGGAGHPQLRRRPPTCATGCRSCGAAGSSRPGRCARSSPTRGTSTRRDLFGAILQDTEARGALPGVTSSGTVGEQIDPGKESQHDRVAARGRRRRRRVPAQGLPQGAVPRPEGRLARHQAAASASGWSASPARARRRSAARCSAWRRSPAARSRYKGREISQLSPRRSPPARSRAEIQVVFQDPYTSLNPALTIEQILTEPLVVIGRSPAEGGAATRPRAARPGPPALERRRPAPPGVLRRPAAAHRDRARPRARPAADRLRRARVRARPVDAGSRARAVQGDPGAHRRLLPLRLATTSTSSDYLSHRVAVMYHGEIVEWGDGEQVTTAPRAPVHAAAVPRRARSPTRSSQEQRRAERSAAHRAAEASRTFRRASLV